MDPFNLSCNTLHWVVLGCILQMMLNKNASKTSVNMWFIESVPRNQSLQLEKHILYKRQTFPPFYCQSAYIVVSTIDYEKYISPKKSGLIKIVSCTVTYLSVKQPRGWPVEPLDMINSVVTLNLHPPLILSHLGQVLGNGEPGKHCLKGALRWCRADWACARITYINIWRRNTQLKRWRVWGRGGSAIYSECFSPMPCSNDCIQFTHDLMSEQCLCIRSGSECWLYSSQ